MFKETDKKIISSLQNPVVKHTVKLRENASYREEKQRVLLFGKTLISELSSFLKPSQLLVLEGTSLEDLPFCENTLFATDNVFKKIANFTFETAIAEFPLPNPTALDGKKYILALDAVADPGNLGSLLRTAVALNWDGVFLLEGCCDLFNDKTVRASRGACLLLPFCYGTYEELFHFSEKNALNFYVANTRGRRIDTIASAKNALLLLSNEARGVKGEVKGKGEEITIPISSKMESLNVAIAGGILMHALRQNDE